MMKVTCHSYDERSCTPHVRGSYVHAWARTMRTAGKCKAEVEKICDDVEQGEGKLADCISDAIAESEASEDDGRVLAWAGCHTVWPGKSLTATWHSPCRRPVHI